MNEQCVSYDYVEYDVVQTGIRMLGTGIIDI